MAIQESTVSVPQFCSLIDPLILSMKRIEVKETTYYTMVCVVCKGSSERCSFRRRVQSNSAYWTEVSALSGIVCVSVVGATDADVRWIFPGIRERKILVEQAVGKRVSMPAFSTMSSRSIPWQSRMH